MHAGSITDIVQIERAPMKTLRRLPADALHWLPDNTQASSTSGKALQSRRLASFLLHKVASLDLSEEPQSSCQVGAADMPEARSIAGAQVVASYCETVSRYLSCVTTRRRGGGIDGCELRHFRSDMVGVARLRTAADVALSGSSALRSLPTTFKSGAWAIMS